MAWKGSSVDEERLRFVVLAHQGERDMTTLCREFGISRQTGYTWLKRYEAGGAAEAGERSRRPKVSPGRTAKEVEEVVVHLRQQRPDWGAPKLLVLLKRQEPDLIISERTVHRILERQGMIRDEDRPTRALGRFERSRPNELWQMDFKGPQGFNTPLRELNLVTGESQRLCSSAPEISRQITQAAAPSVVSRQEGVWN